MRLVRTASTLCGSALVALSFVALAGSPAQADVNGGSTGSGVNLQAVAVDVQGGAGDPVSGGSVSVSVPPTCWWEAVDIPGLLSGYDIDPNEPNAMVKFFEAATTSNTGTFAPARLGYPDAGYTRSRQGDGWTWYQLRSDYSVNCAESGFAPLGGMAPPGWEIGGSNQYPLQYQAFQGAPPPPAVAVEDVVTEVWDLASQEIDGPDLDRNPKATADGVDGATLVNMETWFWVQNVQAALAGDGQIDLEVSIPGSDPEVSASLTASTDGVQITSPAGGVDCDVDQATTEYAVGVAETGACTFPFERANTGGWDVTATTTWTGSWTGTDADGPTGGDLETFTPSATTNVPVAESQAIVDEVG